MSDGVLLLHSSALETNLVEGDAFAYFAKVLIAVQGQEAIFDHNVAAEDLREEATISSCLCCGMHWGHARKAQNRAPLPVA